MLPLISSVDHRSLRHDTPKNTFEPLLHGDPSVGATYLGRSPFPCKRPDEVHFVFHKALPLEIAVTSTLHNLRPNTGCARISHYRDSKHVYETSFRDPSHTMVALANGLDLGTAGSLHSVVGLRPRDIDKPTCVKIKLRRPVIFDRDKLANILHRYFSIYGTIVPMGIYVEPNLQ